MIPDSKTEPTPQRILSESDLAVALAHELRNPMTTLMNLVYLLEHNFEMKHLQMMKKQLLLCESIIGNLLEFSRTRNPSPQSIFLVEFVHQVKSLMEFPPHIDLQIAHEHGELQVYFDPVHLRQVLINLLQNAVEALNENEGHIRIEIKPLENRIRLDVIDDGPGIPEHLDIFEPFVTTKKRGLGLGLGLSKHLVEANQGYMIASRAGSTGSRFSLFLPPAKVSV